MAKKKVKVKKTAFFYPSQPANASSKSPADQANENILKNNAKNNAIINLTEGKMNYNPSIFETFTNKKNIASYYMNRNNPMNNNNPNREGRTLNVPKIAVPGKVPGPSYNGAVTIGEPCVGGHCPVPAEPTVGYMTYQNLRSANPPPGALTQYASTYRPGNNSDTVPGLGVFRSRSKTNPGPYRIHVQNPQQSFQQFS